MSWVPLQLQLLYPQWMRAPSAAVVEKGRPRNTHAINGDVMSTHSQFSRHASGLTQPNCSHAHTVTHVRYPGDECQVLLAAVLETLEHAALVRANLVREVVPIVNEHNLLQGRRRGYGRYVLLLFGQPLGARASVQWSACQCYSGLGRSRD